jgi:hypothetical protein
MLLGPDEIARRIEYRHRPGWVAWYGHQTRCYWALAVWVPGLDAMLSAADPNALDAAITGLERRHPKSAYYVVDN